MSSQSSTRIRNRGKRRKHHEDILPDIFTGEIRDAETGEELAFTNCTWRPNGIGPIAGVPVFYPDCVSWPNKPLFQMRKEKINRFTMIWIHRCLIRNLSSHTAHCFQMIWKICCLPWMRGILYSKNLCKRDHWHGHSVPAFLYLHSAPVASANFPPNFSLTFWNVNSINSAVNWWRGFVIQYLDYKRHSRPRHSSCRSIQ